MTPAGTTIIAATLLAALLAGCQPLVAKPQSLESPVVSQESGDSTMYLRLYDDPTKESGRVTLMARDISILKAIITAYPDAPISADPMIDLNRSIGIWADKLTPTAYLAHLSERADAHIWENAQGQIKVESNAQWQFTLPSGSDRELMSQARQIASQAGARTIVMGKDQQIMLATGTPSQLAMLRTALNQLSDRIDLETRFANL